MSTNRTDIVRPFHRMNNFPLDDTSVFSNESELDNYIKDYNCNIYDGQIVYIKFDKEQMLDSNQFNVSEFQEHFNTGALFVLKRNKRCNRIEKVKILTDYSGTIVSGAIRSGTNVNVVNPLIKDVVQTKQHLPVKAKKGEVYLVQFKLTDDGYLEKSDCIMIRLKNEKLSSDNFSDVWYDAGPIQGPQGIQGEKGDPGIQGPMGPIGPKGRIGDTGERGPQGLQGIQGEQGLDGERGPQGPRGDQGPQGPRGIRGPQGPRGEQGPAGKDGKGLQIDYIFETEDERETERELHDLCFHVGDVCYIRETKRLYIYNYTCNLDTEGNHTGDGEYEWVELSGFSEIANMGLGFTVPVNLGYNKEENPIELGGLKTGDIIGESHINTVENFIKKLVFKYEKPTIDITFEDNTDKKFIEYGQYIDSLKIKININKNNSQGIVECGVYNTENSLIKIITKEEIEQGEFILFENAYRIIKNEVFVVKCNYQGSTGFDEDGNIIMPDCGQFKDGTVESKPIKINACRKVFFENGYGEFNEVINGKTIRNLSNNSIIENENIIIDIVNESNYVIIGIPSDILIKSIKLNNSNYDIKDIIEVVGELKVDGFNKNENDLNEINKCLTDYKILKLQSNYKLIGEKLIIEL